MVILRQPWITHLVGGFALRPQRSWYQAVFPLKRHLHVRKLLARWQWNIFFNIGILEIFTIHILLNISTEAVQYLPSATVVAEILCFHKRLLFCPRVGWCTPLGRHHPQTDTPRADTLPPKTATAAEGTHLTGMHSCSQSIY